jgi:hypothetical protein
LSLSARVDEFFREVAASGELFAVEHEGRGPVDFHLAGGTHARVFWSARSRALAMVEGPLRRSGLVIVTHHWPEFRDAIVPELKARDLLVGVNWSGVRARGGNLEPDTVVQGVEALLARRAAG